MKLMNEAGALVLPLRELMGRPDGWGRKHGREVHQRLLSFVEGNPGKVVFRISMKGVKRMDISFASETIIELARRFRRTKGFCIVHLADPDLIENIDAAGRKKQQPMLVWLGNSARLIGFEPSGGTRGAFQFALECSQVRASEYSSEKDISISNASMKFKQLWDMGFLLRQESTADTGGVEFLYYRIG